jgi:hypothetical protein
MAVQGVNFLLRAALSRAPILLIVTETTDEKGLTKISTRQEVIGRVSEEERFLNWESVPSKHPVFGPVDTKQRITAISELTLPALQEGWEEGAVDVIELFTQGKDWTSWQAWGFETVNGERRHVRKVVIQKGLEPVYRPAEAVAMTMVYDWVV